MKNDVSILEKPQAVQKFIDQELYWLKENYKSGNLDPELYPVLVELNSAGFITHQSCAGHSRDNGECGCIEFRGEYKKHSAGIEGIMWILAKHGLEGIRFYPGLGAEATFGAIGSQYGPGDLMTAIDPSEGDEAGQIPPIPDKCPTCGKADFWLHGGVYEFDQTLEWMCKNCQPKPFNQNSQYITPAIRKRRLELPKVKLWEIERIGNDELHGTNKPYRMRAENENALFKKMGFDPYDDGDNFYDIKRIE